MHTVYTVAIRKTWVSYESSSYWCPWAFILSSTAVSWLYVDQSLSCYFFFIYSTLMTKDFNYELVNLDSEVWAILCTYYNQHMPQLSAASSLKLHRHIYKHTPQQYYHVMWCKQSLLLEACRAMQNPDMSRTSPGRKLCPFFPDNSWKNAHSAPQPIKADSIVLKRKCKQGGI